MREDENLEFREKEIGKPLHSGVEFWPHPPTRRVHLSQGSGDRRWEEDRQIRSASYRAKEPFLETLTTAET